MSVVQIVAIAIGVVIYSCIIYAWGRVAEFAKAKCCPTCTEVTGGGFCKDKDGCRVRSQRLCPSCGRPR